MYKALFVDDVECIQENSVICCLFIHIVYCVGRCVYIHILHTPPHSLVVSLYCAFTIHFEFRSAIVSAKKPACEKFIIWDCVHIYVPAPCNSHPNDVMDVYIRTIYIGLFVLLFSLSLQSIGLLLLFYLRFCARNTIVRSTFIAECVYRNTLYLMSTMFLLRVDFVCPTIQTKPENIEMLSVSSCM